MNDTEFVTFLQWALPRLHLRFRGFRRVRGTVHKRLRARIAELGLQSLADYRARLETDAGEWQLLDAMCRIPISRFHRDRATFEVLRTEILPERANAAIASGRAVRVWSAGCASGEEPYTIAILWQLEIARAIPGVPIEIIATDAAPHMVERARRGCYPRATLGELPDRFAAEAFHAEEDLRCVRDDLRALVDVRCEDIRRTMPDGPFDVVLCRNLAFTYFDEPLARALSEQFAARLAPGGVLVIGAHEALPEGSDWVACGPSIYRGA